MWEFCTNKLIRYKVWWIFLSIVVMLKKCLGYKLFVSMNALKIRYFTMMSKMSTYLKGQKALKKCFGHNSF
jgi:hypothetical protein